MKPTLTELAMKYGSDKLYSHSYLTTYESLFEGRDVKRLLEVGIGFESLMKDFTPRFVPHSSLRMWEEFFQTADIFAIDIRKDVLVNEGRIHTMVCDQSKEEDLQRMTAEWGESFSVVVDDGSHLLLHQQITARYLVPKMRPNSLYVIEDTYQDTAQVLAKEFNGQVVYGSKRPDDNLVVIER